MPALQRALDRFLTRERFDVVNLEFPYLAHLRVRQAPAGQPSPAVVVDTHEIAYDMVRQVARSKGALGRRVCTPASTGASSRREELAAYRTADGVCGLQRGRQEARALRRSVGADGGDAQRGGRRALPAPLGDPPPDGRTVLFFGLLSTFPNVDGLQFFLREIWPRIARERPGRSAARSSGRAARWLSALAGPRIEVTGFVEDLRPHLAAAAAVVVPLRLGGGTRLKIVEAMAMARPIVSTTPRRRGHRGGSGRDLLIADEPAAFAAAVVRVLDNPELAAQLGRPAARSRGALLVDRSGNGPDRFFGEVMAGRPGSSSSNPSGHE